MTERYAHVFGDYHIDREIFERWHWWGTAILCVALPPVGLAILGFLAVSSLTTDTDD